MLRGEIRRRRLSELRRVVENAPDELLSMSHFSKKVSCGTAHCAAGWAALDPYFTERGLSLTAHGGLRYYYYMSFDAFHDLAYLFKISVKASRKLFGCEPPQGDNWKNVKKEHVLANIDRMLAGKQPFRYTLRNLSILVPA